MNALNPISTEALLSQSISGCLLNELSDAPSRLMQRMEASGTALLGLKRQDTIVLELDNTFSSTDKDLIVRAGPIGQAHLDMQ